MENTTNVPSSRTLLESMSTGELIKLAEDIGIDIPPGLERIFIIEEILDNSGNEGKEEKDDLQVNPSYIEPVFLPKQYNISFIEIIIRDPLWVFVFWEIKGNDRELHEKASDFNGYCLRVIPLNEGETITKSKENSYTVSIEAGDTARYLGFAEQTPQDTGRFIIKLSVIRGDTELQLAISQPFTLPRLVYNDSFSNTEQHPLIRLSGVQDFSTIKNTDRKSRIKRQ
jgi:hypothetical protein